jgi:hypothetical protein
MKGIPLPVFFLLLLFGFFTWAIIRFLKRILKPRASLARLFLYILSGFALMLILVFAAERLILWWFPNPLK